MHCESVWSRATSVEARSLTPTSSLQGLGSRSVNIDDEDDDEVIERNLAKQYLASCAPSQPASAPPRPSGLDGNEEQKRPDGAV